MFKISTVYFSSVMLSYCIYTERVTEAFELNIYSKSSAVWIHVLKSRKPITSSVSGKDPFSYKLNSPSARGVL